MRKVFTKGFTLVELVIAIAIIAIMSSVILAISAEEKAQEEVRAAANELAGRINDMRQRSLKGDVGANGTACGFGVYLPGNGMIRSFYRKTESGCENNDKKKYDSEIKTPTISTWSSTRVAVGTPGMDEGPQPPQNIFFEVPFGNKTVSDGLANGALVQSGSHQMCVFFSSSGFAEVRDGSCQSTP